MPQAGAPPSPWCYRDCLRLHDDRILDNCVPNPNRPAFQDARSQTAAVDEWSEDRLADQFLEVLAGRAILDALEQHFANAEPLTKKTIQSHTTGCQIAAVFGNTQRDPMLSAQPVKDFGLKERDLAGARIGRTGGVEAEAGEVPVAGQAYPSHGLNFGHRLHLCAGAERDMDRLDLSH